MSNEKINKENIAKQMVESIMNDESSTELEKMLKDNKIPFSYKNKKYRVRKPTWKEQEKLNKARMKKFNELLEDKDYLFRDQLIERYKNKGIDFEKIEARINTITGTVNTLRIQVTESENKSVKDAKKAQIVELMNEQALLVMKKTDLLSYSLEDTLMIYVNSYLISLILEEEVESEDKEKDESKWVRVFKDYEGLENCDDVDLINRSLYYLNFLVYNEAQ